MKHFYTTRLGACGDHDPKTVQALSRHGDFAQTWETYAHPPVAVEGVTVTTFTRAFATATLLGPDAVQSPDVGDKTLLPVNPL